MISVGVFDLIYPMRIREIHPELEVGQEVKSVGSKWGGSTSTHQRCKRFNKLSAIYKERFLNDALERLYPSVSEFSMISRHRLEPLIHFTDPSFVLKIEVLRPCKRRHALVSQVL